MSGLKEWINAKIHDLHSIARLVERCYPVNPELDFQANPWTVLKLLVLLVYTPVYTAIIKGRYRNMVYIDLFSGSGLIYYKNTKTALAGSPLVSLFAAIKPFDYAFLNDQNKEKIKLLKKRITYLQKSERINKNINIEYLADNANNLTQYIVNKLNTFYRVHALVFIDPPGLEYKWNALQLLLKARVRMDIIMLFQTYSAAMQIIGTRRENRPRLMKLNELFGTSSWKNYILEKTGKESLSEINRTEAEILLKEFYLNKIRNTLKEIIGSDDFAVIDVNLKLEKIPDASYSIIFISKHSGPYLRVWDYIKGAIENAPEGFVSSVIDALSTGRVAPGLAEFLDKYVERVEELKILRRFKLLKAKSAQNLCDFFPDICSVKCD